MKHSSENGPEGPKPERLSYVQSRLVRLTQGGSQSAQAGIIGFTLATPVVCGFLAGWWIDQKFGTSYWVIIIGVLGVFSGFREMFKLVNTLQPKAGQRTPPPGRQTTTRKPAPQPEVPDNSPKPRLFTVPPPPFVEGGTKGAIKPQKSGPQSADEVLKELLGEDDDKAKT